MTYQEEQALKQKNVQKLAENLKKLHGDNFVCLVETKENQVWFEYGGIPFSATIDWRNFDKFEISLRISADKWSFKPSLGYDAKLNARNLPTLGFTLGQEERAMSRLAKEFDVFDNYYSKTEENYSASVAAENKKQEITTQLQAIVGERLNYITQPNGQDASFKVYGDEIECTLRLSLAEVRLVWEALTEAKKKL